MTEFTLTVDLQAHAAVVLCTKTYRTHKTKVSLQNQWASVQKYEVNLSHFKDAVKKKK